MTRPRAKADEAYVKKTVSIPPDTWVAVEEYLSKSPRLTLSSLVTEAVEYYIKGSTDALV